MTAVCPGCGVQLDIVPGYLSMNGRRFDFGVCANDACPVVSIRIEWRKET